MTAAEYHHLVATFDQRHIDSQINAIPLNINRAGKHYQKLIKHIHENNTPRI